MKVSKSYPSVLYRVILLQILCAFILGVFFPKYTHDLFYLQMLMIPILLLQCFKNPKPELKKRLTYPTWVLQILLWQSSLFFLYLGLTQTFSERAFPPLHTLFSSYGLFPFLLITALSIALLTQARQKETVYFGDLIHPDLKLNHLRWSMTNVSIRISLFTVVFSAIFLIILLPTQWIMTAKPAFNLPTLVSTLFIVLFTFSRPYKKLLQLCLSKKYLYWGWMGALILLAAIWFLLHWLLPNTALNPPVFLKVFSLHSNDTALLGALAWWFGAGILSALYLARISIGYSAREITLHTLLLPIIFLFLPWNIPNTLLIPLALLSSAYLFYCLLHKNFLSLFTLGYFTTQLAPKARECYFTLRRQIQLTAFLAYLIFPTGNIIFSLILLGYILPATCVLFFIRGKSWGI